MIDIENNLLYLSRSQRLRWECSQDAPASSMKKGEASAFWITKFN